MILLHLLLAVLYAAGVWALWPVPVQGAGGVSPGTPKWTGIAPLLVPAALLLHAWLVSADLARPEGLDLSFANALSVVSGMCAIVAWASGLFRTLPMVASVVLPIAGIFSLLPIVGENPHPFPYGESPWAAAHVAVALLAYALLIIAAVQALVLIWLEKRLHRGLGNSADAELPPLLTLERLLFRLVALGFVLLTLTVVSGVFFSETLFGKPLTSNHKTVFSILSWLVFAGLLVGRRRYGWRGRVALRWILTGTTLLFLAYLGSKFVLEVLLHR
ncbi:MAG: cytochrome c biogenesis protein CcsA [Pseudomonadota bacterium]|nr:cytochrome c biogenesis protein CcsA [Pseudomonadota bacterium]